MMGAVIPRLRSGRGSGWFLVGYAGAAGFFALEATLRRKGSASSLTASPDDRGTTRMIIAAYMISAGVAPLLPRTALPELPRSAGPAGLGLETIGLALRAWSMRSLGGFYSRTLRTEDEQQVVDTGPYRWVRHPGYSGSLLTWTGFALTSRSLPVVALVAGLLVGAYQRRITAEEQLLLRELPGYTAYTERTKKLFPAVW